MIRRFADSAAASADRTALLAGLQALGMDTAPITPETPDEVLRAFLECAQKLQVPTTTPADAAAVQKEADRLQGRFQTFSDRARFRLAKTGALPIDPARRERMLNATAAGRAILASEKKK